MLLFLGLIGCGGGPNTVAGKVTYKGAPVTGGSITLDLGGGKTAGGSLDPKGEYSIQVTSTGKAAVTIETESIKSGGVPMGADIKVSAEEKAKMAEVSAGLKGGGLGAYVKIPLKYMDAKTSGLTVDVKSGKTNQNFDLAGD